ncbi:uncharacterized protein LOC143446261 isoform X2 [Clavelina lepadiformis]|uniref:uncharacterized protein LOC143446261 isoform X2 n=1 Tax=Clavelina lepadiformis TaxID=159417 RepID=UPI00404256F3
MNSIELVVTFVAVFAIFGDAGKIHALKEPRMLSVQDLSCYKSDGLTAQLVKCPEFNNRCGSGAYDITLTQPATHVDFYFCADDKICANPKAYCDELQKVMPEVPIKNCNLKCCESNGCNKPKEDDLN